jgi:hypothetical protein
MTTKKTTTKSKAAKSMRNLPARSIDAKTARSGKGGDEAPKETVTFEYGGLVVKYAQQSPTGKVSKR